MENFGTEFGFCAQTASIWQFIGTLLLVCKVIMPVILIVIGIITLGKAVISDDEKDIKKGFSSLLKKFILAVVMFFIPQIVSACFTIVNGFNEIRDDYNVCNDCIVNPRGENCSSKVEYYNEA